MFEVSVNRDARSVEGWSDVRLPYDPRGESLEFKTRLRAALASLQALPGEVLHATYTSSVEGSVDAENVLIYNVGVGAFRGAAAHGLVFERRFASPPEVHVPGWNPAHHHRYALAPPDYESANWRRVQRIAWWPWTAATGAALRTPALAWWLARRAIHIEGTTAPGLPIEVSLQVVGDARPASAVKPLLDGFIAALHAHDGTAADEVARCIGSAMNVPKDDVARMLVSPAPLGARTLVRLRGRGVQWDPEDERCVLGRLVVGGGRATEISGEVWELSPVSVPR